LIVTNHSCDLECPIYTVNMGGLSLMHAFVVNPQIQECQIWNQETRTISLSYGVKYISVSWTIQLWLTTVMNRQTDRHSDNKSRASYVVWPKSNILAGIQKLQYVTLKWYISHCRSQVMTRPFTSIMS